MWDLPTNRLSWCRDLPLDGRRSWSAGAVYVGDTYYTVNANLFSAAVLGISPRTGAVTSNVPLGRFPVFRFLAAATCVD